MKIGLAQINSTVGDFVGNAEKLLAVYHECSENEADLIVSPECSIVGYPPQDLVYRSGFVDSCLQALDCLAKEVKEVPFLVGYIDHRIDGKKGKPFYNSAAFLWRGEIYKRIYKILLPTYDVFDERRYYEPGNDSQLIEWKGVRLGITICEDIWDDEFLPSPLYECDPLGRLELEGGVDVLINMSASPFHLGKPEVREKLLAKVATRLNCSLVYCNAVGANDQLIFDGNSLVISKEKKIVSRFPSFIETGKVIDTEQANPPPVGHNSNEMDSLYNALVLGIRDYVRKCGLKTSCLGLSGGIDSAITATLAVEALGASNVSAITMPSEYSSIGSIEDSLKLAENLKFKCSTISIQKVFESVKYAMGPIFQNHTEDVTEENMQARIRGLFLMALSNKTGHLLLTTGNKSELAVGYCTMYGDMCGGLAVLSDVPKTKVYELAHWINRREEVIPWSIIKKPPSAELRFNQTDQDTLPSYEVLDIVLEKLINQQMSPEKVVQETGIKESVVLWIQERIFSNEWKRHQAAPGLRVTTKAFGFGRRIPIVHKFQH